MAARIHLAGSSDRKGFWFSRAVAIAAQVPVCLSASSARPVLGSWLQHTRQRLLQSPPSSNRAWPENIRFDKRIVFFSPHYRADFYVKYSLGLAIAGCKSMRQKIHRFPPHYSSRSRYETVKAWRPSDHARHHSVVDLVEEET